MDKRDVVLDWHSGPNPSGYGGFSQWTIQDLDEASQDYLWQELNKLVQRVAKKAGVEGGFTGAI